ncbi:stress response protein nst1-like protein [Acrodontium crateriforme]|uniref:Stress response protein NST1 n=1 Tax=Acrodontium crateriforme TaxID=150365 RepID=A0AAQ3MA64_9PEZI|nr:stress response protein nst1-like protein [Acrodontium crateriforme]
MASTTTANPPPPPTTNGLMSAPSTAPPPAGNRKKQKRRAKQAAKAAQHAPTASQAVAGHPTELDYDEDPLGSGDDDYEYSDAEADSHYHDHYHLSQHAAPNGVHPSAPRPSKKRNKKKASAWHDHGAYNPDVLPPPPNAPPPPSSALRSMHKNPPHHVGNIWNTSTQQERQNIKDFWLSLSEDERKSLLKIEKEAVLRKMKQQQKHSCSCTVCGRKRTAIEEELEVLYEGYYEELEQYAHHDHPPLPSTEGLIPGPLHQARQPALSSPPKPVHKTSHLHEHLDDEEFSDEEEYSDDEEEYSDEEPEPEPRPGVPDFFNFGQNLTVKGILTPWLEKLQIGLKGKADNLLTVADDLLKNDGRKFIEMMEQLAERRMQRENEAEYAAANPTHPGAYPPSDAAYNGEDPLAVGDEFDDDEASYDSQEEYDDDLEEEDEMGGLTEEQRMQEGRRMFQIFAARMFEQRVLTAYREKVAAERQQKLLEELEDETNREAQKEAKKQRDAQKKKDKKKQQQQAKAEEKARKDAEKAAEEARLKEAEEKKQEEQRRKKEEQRKKREEERKKQEEERARKEADKQRRVQEEQARREDAERKAKEQKAAEKAKKEEARKREREEREAREKELRERKMQDEKERKDRESKSKFTQLSHQNPPQIAKRPPQGGPVAVPGAHPKQSTIANRSPHPVIATPALPKAPTPARQRQTSHQDSHGSSPKQTASQMSSAPSKASSPSNSSGQQHPSTGPKTIMQKPGGQMPGLQHPMQTTSPLHQQQIQPPPGMSHPQHPGGFGGMTPMGFAGFPGPQGLMMQGNMGHRSAMPMYPHQGPPIGVLSRMPFGMNGIPTPPPGMMPQQGRGMMFPYDISNPGQPPSGFGQHHVPHQSSPPIGPPHAQGPPGGDAPRGSISTHSRQHSSDKERFEANHPIQRPAPIQRPSSVKPGQGRNGPHAEVEDLSKHLGSSALLADDDEPLPVNPVDNRRHSGMALGVRSISNAGLHQLGGGFGAPTGGFGTPGPNWAAPSPFGQQPGLGQQSWGSLPSPGMSGWIQNNNAFAANGAFGSIGAAPMHRPTGTSLNRPLTIRLAVCQACKQLSSENGGHGDGFHDVNELLHRIEANNRPLLDSPPTLRELEEICETEGDSQNGGGELYIRRSSASGGDAFAVKWEPDTHSSDPSSRGHIGGLGEIGSPVPAKTTPAIGFGAPGMGRASSGGFQNMSAVGSAPNF